MHAAAAAHCNSRCKVDPSPFTPTLIAPTCELHALLALLAALLCLLPSLPSRAFARFFACLRVSSLAFLQIAKGASISAVRAAYRQRALETHPDRGGSPGTFLLVQHAYRRLVEQMEEEARAKQDGGGGGEQGAGGMPVGGSKRKSSGGAAPQQAALDASGRPALLEGPKVDVELKEHRALVE